ncbi:MAG: rane transport protein [Candidatus Saccharibacteria bacterium]|nr:rane transport protein [Candidatus Saccharibacteria bacterium]
MGHFLHKLGRFCFEKKWWVISGWIIIVLILGLLAAKFFEAPSSAISIPGTEAQKTLDRFAELFPSTGKGSARIVLKAPEGKTIADYQSSVNQLITQVTSVKGINGAISPFLNPAAVSRDETIAYIQLQLENGAGSLSKDVTTAVADRVNDARKDGLQVEMGGDVISKTPGEILGIGEVAGVVLALVVLVMTLGSLTAAGMPIITALVAVGASISGLFALSQVVQIGATTPVLAVMLGLAVGIDYSLFIVSKYRSYLLQGFDYKAAVARSIGTAGNAVLFAAATVVIALSALTIVRIPFMSTMGLAGAGTVAFAAFVAVTLIPAMLGVTGPRVFSRRVRARIVKAQAEGPQSADHISHKTAWYKWGEFITKYSIPVLILAVIAVGVIALPVRDLKLGLPTDEYAAKNTTERKAYDLLKEGFGPGFNGPLLLVIEGLPKVTDEDKQVVRSMILAQYAAQTPKIAMTPQMLQAAQVQLEAQVEQYARLHQLGIIAERIGKLDDVANATPGLATSDGTSGIIQVTADSAPADQPTLDLIKTLRDPSKQKQLTGNALIKVGVTGSTALQGDINQKLTNALPLYLGTVIGLSFILLIIAFRSILIPIKATLGFLLSVLAMFGVLVAVFQWGWFGVAAAPGPIVSFIPIIAIGVLFGLAMDYEFFLVSSMHESYSHTKDARRAVLEGFGMGSKVVTAAGIIMVSVFAGFISNHDVTIQAIGFGLAFGIFIDAFIVRMTIVPALMTLLGKSAWWLPRWLDRIIPHVAIEGEEPEPRPKH